MVKAISSQPFLEGFGGLCNAEQFHRNPWSTPLPPGSSITRSGAEGMGDGDQSLTLVWRKK